MEDKNEKINKLKKNYRNSTHPSFMQTDVKKIFTQLKDDLDYDITYSDIEQFKTDTEEISRQRQLRLLRGAKRFASFRQAGQKITRREKKSFFTSLFVCSFAHSHIHSFIYSLIHSFVQKFLTRPFSSFIFRFFVFPFVMIFVQWFSGGVQGNPRNIWLPCFSGRRTRLYLSQWAILFCFWGAHLDVLMRHMEFKSATNRPT